MLAVEETISYSNSWNKIIGITAAFIGAILITLLVILVILWYGEQTEYKEQTTDSWPIEWSALPSHYILSHLLWPNDPNPNPNSDPWRYKPQQPCCPPHRTPHLSLPRKSLILPQEPYMTPDLTNMQTIAIGSAIAGTVLIFFFTALIFLTFKEQIRRFLQRQGLLVPARNPHNFRNTPFPTHYVLPYQPDPVWPRMGLSQTASTIMHCSNSRTTTTIECDSFNEYVSSQKESLPPRNTTLGPSNVCRSPTPESTNTPDLIQVLQVANPDPWAGTENAVPDPDPEWPVSVWTADDTPEWYQHWDTPVDYQPELPDLVFPESHDPSPPYASSGQIHLPWVYTWISLSHTEGILHFRRFPNDSDVKDSDSDSSLPLAPEQPRLRYFNHHGRPRSSSDSLNPHGLDYDWAWTIHSGSRNPWTRTIRGLVDLTTRHWHQDRRKTMASQLPRIYGFLPCHPVRGSTWERAYWCPDHSPDLCQPWQIHISPCLWGETDSMFSDQGLRTNSGNWRLTYSSYLTNWRPASGWRDQDKMAFDHFNYDQTTFRREFQPSRSWRISLSFTWEILSPFLTHHPLNLWILCSSTGGTAGKGQVK